MRATGDTTRRNDEGDGWHNNSKGQHDNMRHNDGNRRQHGDDKGQQGNRRYNIGDGRHDKVARRRRSAANYYD
jgi:hypothetical protein